MKKQFPTVTHLILLTALLATSVTLYFQGAKAFSVDSVISHDTVWTFSNSPYEVVNNVTVESGAKLTIEPGVEIRFETGTSLIINGSLYAVGTNVSRISFTSNNNEPIAGDWNGIRFHGDENNTLTTKFCDVQYARDGVVIESLGRAVIDKCTIVHNSLSGILVVDRANSLIRENVIELNANGISTSGITSSGLKIIDNNISNNENGVYLYVYGDDSRILNVTVSGNSLKDNANGICLQSSARPSATPNSYINNVTISNNLIESTEYGIHLLAQAWGEPGLLGGGAYIYNSVISQNNISFSKHALYIDSTSNWYSWISNLTISRNVIHSSTEGIFIHAFRTPKPPYIDVPFDVVLVSNVISANSKGVSIFGDVRVYFTGNSISYNSWGVSLISTPSVPSENVAYNNDIYRNTEYGVYVDGVSINAEYNYWGALSGPYHEDLNPTGEGDRVNGNGENLDFTPFSIKPFGVVNVAPFAVLKADKTKVAVNQTVVFDCSESNDDSSIIKYFFDFGDGEIMQVLPGVVGHKYASAGTYIVSLTVMDDLGVNSTNTATEIITVGLPPSLVVSVFLNPSSVVSQGHVTVEVHVSDGMADVQGASIELESEPEGNFEPSSGHTDSNGNFESTFSAPNMSEPTNVRITATAYKEGYEIVSYDVYLSVLTPRPGETTLGSPWIWFVAVVAVITVVVVTLVKKKRTKAKPQCKIMTDRLVHDHKVHEHGPGCHHARIWTQKPLN